MKTLISLTVLFLFVLFLDCNFNEYSFNYKLNQKIKCNEDNITKSKIIIGGDSRSVYQIIPREIMNITNEECVNISYSGSDIFTWVNSLIETGNFNKVFNKDKIVVLSFSISNVNDGAIDIGYTSKAAITNFNIIDKLTIYKGNYDKLITTYQGIIKDFILDNLNIEKNIYTGDTSRGYEGGYKYGKSKMTIDTNTVINHQFYKNINIEGVKWNLFLRYMTKLAETGTQILILQPPINPAWNEYTKGTFIEINENKFYQNISSFMSGYTNIKLWNLYNNYEDVFTDYYFYDIQHLNYEGAKIYSKMIADYINKNFNKKL